jgi:hypothetical protein
LDAKEDAEQILELAKHHCRNLDDGAPVYDVCLETLTTLYTKAPEWTTDQSKIREIVNSIDSYWSHFGQVTGNALGFQWTVDNVLDPLDGKHIEFENRRKGILDEYDPNEEEFPEGTSVPTSVFNWLETTMNTGELSNNIARIHNDRTHLLLELDTGRYSRVSVSKLLQEYNAPVELYKEMTKLPQKKGVDDVQITISRRPADILMKSTGQWWTSCESAGDCYDEGPVADVEIGSAIAIVKKNNNINSVGGKWAGRVMLRPCIDNEGEPNVGIEPRMYGDENMETVVLSKIKEYLNTEYNLANYDYCFTPYKYGGYSDQVGRDGIIIYGDRKAGMDRIADEQIYKVTQDLGYGVCKSLPTGGGYQETSASYKGKFWEGDLAQLYRETRELHKDWADALGMIKHPGFIDVTMCNKDYLLEDYDAWRKLPEVMNRVIPRLQEFMGNELWVVKDFNHRDRLFAATCRNSYNWSEYEVIYKRLLAVEETLNLIDNYEETMGVPDDHPEVWKLKIIEQLSPFNKYGEGMNAEEPRPLTMDYEVPTYPHAMEDLCGDLMNESLPPEPTKFAIANHRVGYDIDSGGCPIISPEAERLREKCRIWEIETSPAKRKDAFMFNVKRRISEGKLTVDEGRLTIRNYEMSRYTDPVKDDPYVRVFMEDNGEKAIFDPAVTDEGTRARYLRWVEEHPGELPPREFFPG